MAIKYNDFSNADNEDYNDNDDEDEDDGDDDDGQTCVSGAPRAICR